jgi:hypothetical protein
MCGHGRSGLGRSDFSRRPRQCFRGVKPKGPAQRKRCTQHRQCGYGAKPQGKISRWLVVPESPSLRRQAGKQPTQLLCPHREKRSETGAREARSVDRRRSAQTLETTQRGSRAPDSHSRVSECEPMPANKNAAVFQQRRFCEVCRDQCGGLSRWIPAAPRSGCGSWPPYGTPLASFEFHMPYAK